MGRSQDVQSLEEKDKKFKAYLKNIQDDLQTRSAVQVGKMTQEISDYYEEGGWKSEKFIAGQNVDFMHSSTWSLDRLTEVVNTISSAVFGGTGAPAGTSVTPTPSIGTALADMASLQLYFASRVLAALTGVLEAFGTSTSVTFKTQYKSEVLGNGFHLFTVMACDSYDDQGFFKKEKILEYLYAYEVRFSMGEANSHTKIPLINALNQQIKVLADKMNLAGERWSKEELDDDQYMKIIDTYRAIQDKLTGQLSDLGEENKKALLSLVAVPPMILD